MPQRLRNRLQGETVLFPSVIVSWLSINRIPCITLLLVNFKVDRHFLFKLIKRERNLKQIISISASTPGPSGIKCKTPTEFNGDKISYRNSVGK